MPRDLTNLLVAAERLIRFGLEPRGSTKSNDGNVFVSISGDSRNRTWHVSLARAIQLDEIASRARTGKPFGTGKAAIYSSLREEDYNTGGTSLCIK